MDLTQLRARIAARGLSLKQVAYACGVSQPAVSQWFASGPSSRPIPLVHQATIQALLGDAPAYASAAVAPAKQRRTPLPQQHTSPPQRHASLTSEPQQLPAAPARKHWRARPVSLPHLQPMYWGAPPFLGQEPAPRSLIHYPGHWALPPVMPPPPPAYISPAAAAGPRHSDVVAAHNRASQRGENPDVRSDAAPEFPLAQFFGLTMPIRHEDREAFEGEIARYAAERGFADASEVRLVIEALRAAVRRHNQKFSS